MLSETGAKVASHLEVKCHEMCTDIDLGDHTFAANKESVSSITGSKESSYSFCYASEIADSEFSPESIVKEASEIAIVQLKIVAMSSVQTRDPVTYYLKVIQ